LFFFFSICPKCKAAVIEEELTLHKCVSSIPSQKRGGWSWLVNLDGAAAKTCLQRESFLEDSSGDHAPEYSILCRHCVLAVFEAYGLEGVEGSPTRSYDACRVSVNQDHSNWFVSLHGRIFSLRHVGRGASISIKKLNNNETARENFHPLCLGKVEYMRRKNFQNRIQIGALAA